MNIHPRSVPGALAPLRVLSLLVVVTVGLGACVGTNPPTDTGNPVAPSSSSATPQPQPQPTPTSSQSLAYTPDLKAIFDSDCVVCHSGGRPSAGYSMTTYAAVMQAVIPGNPNSRLVVWTQPGGTMYRFWTGNPSQKAAMVRQWVVNDNAAQSR